MQNCGPPHSKTLNLNFTHLGDILLNVRYFLAFLMQSAISQKSPFPRIGCKSHVIYKCCSQENFTEDFAVFIFWRHHKTVPEPTLHIFQMYRNTTKGEFAALPWVTIQIRHSKRKSRVFELRMRVKRYSRSMADILTSPPPSSWILVISWFSWMSVQKEQQTTSRKSITVLPSIPRIDLEHMQLATHQRRCSFRAVFKAFLHQTPNPETPRFFSSGKLISYSLFCRNAAFFVCTVGVSSMVQKTAAFLGINLPFCQYTPIRIIRSHFCSLFPSNF